MKKLVVSIWIFFLTVNQAFAMSPITTLIIRDAQAYGLKHASVSHSEFMAPWTAYEANAKKLDEMTDYAYIYTPYLLVATDAREKARDGQKPLIEHSEKALAQYDGYFVFRVTIFSEKAAALDKLNASLVQEKQNIPMYYMSTPIPKQTAIGGKLIYFAQVYVYFTDKTIFREKPILLAITDNAEKSHTFFFNLDKIR